jgi:hydroxymethylpyrimidine pyrophosphatase-like HAD family hydrolase
LTDDAGRSSFSWLLFADLDGTLIIEPGGVGPKLLELIGFAAKNAGSLIPVTARPVPHLAEMFRACDLNSFVIGNGGAVIARLEAGSFEVIAEEALDPAAGSDFLRALWRWGAAELGVTFFFQGSEADFEVCFGGAVGGLDPDDLATIVGPRPMRHVEGPPADEGLLGISLLAPCDPTRLLPFKADPLLPSAWRATVYPEYRIPGWSWLEVLPAGATKAAAVRRVLRSWGEADAGPATVAVGDAIDDVGMFDLVDTSFSPSDASEPARMAATEVLDAPGGEEFAAEVLDRMERLASA